jgi:hypothetical protein
MQHDMPQVRLKPLLSPFLADLCGHIPDDYSIVRGKITWLGHICFLVTELLRIPQNSQSIYKWLSKNIR